MKRLLALGALFFALSCGGPEAPQRRCSNIKPCGDGFVCSNAICAEDRDGDGYGAPQDCDDLDVLVHPGAEEVCDGLDNDCDGATDPALSLPCENACGPGRRYCVEGAYGACDAQAPEAAEVCDNGVDDDCNGSVDEGCRCTPGELKACGEQQGRCAGGSQRCGADGLWEPCHGAGQAIEERCGDGIDDDCDGDIDEGCECTPGQTQDCGSDAGPCGEARGVQLCGDDGSWGDCEGAPQPQMEVCNLLDDDCDGLTDEDLDVVCTTACGSGVRRCDGGRPGRCTAPAPLAEICDGLDNDCDGAVDEDCRCEPGRSTPCGRELGRCLGGEQRCGADGAWGDCEGAVGPETELCDGVDNDCDGAVDEECGCEPGSVVACGSGTGECREGTQICGADGRFGPCLGGEAAQAERCNGADDDCDGATDDGCACLPGEMGSCGSAVGECRVGTRRCLPSGDWGPCDGGRMPVPERCGTGLDEDCDGEVDEACGCEAGQVRACGSAVGLCAPGVEICDEAGAWGACMGATAPREELCNGADDDCDGLWDEGCACAPGESMPCGSAVGACSLGTQICGPDGQFGACFGGVEATEERCGDLVDNDCDGRVDEGCECNPGDLQACGNGVGACEPGTQTCLRDGLWGPCNGVRGPKPEACNGEDDDCDGAVDEGVTRACESACGAGVERCVAGEFEGCSAPQPQPEACDGHDDDCDGEIDEGCRCEAGEVQRCASSVGACRAGSRRCGEDGRYGVCEGGRGAEAEICNGEDDDCDGAVDEGCECSSGQSLPCGSAVGQCRPGRQVCAQDGLWGVCAAAVGPQAEQCNGADDDCDGVVDEGCECEPGALMPCGAELGACTPGTQRCGDDGVWGSCEGAVLPEAEQCNGVDDDCDGRIDEGCPCALGETRPCGEAAGLCRQGEQRCTPEGWGACLGAVLPVAEACNGEDDNCDGRIDEGCECMPGATTPCGSEVGACELGVQRCDRFGRWGGCEGGRGPTPELCNGVDDDCDQSVDEDLRRLCDGACGVGFERCGGGEFLECSAALPEAEQCDGVDNDCDGFVDEDCGCEPGALAACGLNHGRCQPGLTVCGAGGNWGPCVGAIEPEVEVCNGVDDDCDGVADEDCGCEPGDALPCGRQVGVCRQGQRFCGQDGSWGVECAGEVLPAPEQCNGLDDDCDGLIDEDAGCRCEPGQMQDCGAALGTCSPGIQRCTQDGIWGRCEGAVGPRPEQCNGLDEDCDGRVDEGLLDCCEPGALRACGSGQGSCQPGVQSCRDGGFWGPCEGAVQPGEEICDGQDNDCDGSVDEFAEGCLCQPGQLLRCGSDVGACSAGQQICQADLHWGICEGAVGPRDEQCNGLDDDCDGEIPADEIDEDRDSYAACAGDCDDSNGAVHPLAEEACNGRDDNCDGLIGDEERDLDRDGYRSCDLTEFRDCDDTDPRVRPGAPEVCNGRDDDCDGRVHPDEADFDQDGYDACRHGDCADNDAAVFPNAWELCGTNEDRNCDGRRARACGGDFDGDGYRSVRGCGPLECQSGVCPARDCDCDDNDPHRNPGEAEVCDGKDNDCDGVLPPGERDADGDGHFLCGDDCDDDEAAVHPGAIEICDGQDNDCDGELDGEVDEDGDGISVCAGDCNDSPGVGDRMTPGAAEVCDGVDNDCDGVGDAEDPDAQRDCAKRDCSQASCHGWALQCLFSPNPCWPRCQQVSVRACVCGGERCEY